MIACTGPFIFLSQTRLLLQCSIGFEKKRCKCSAHRKQQYKKKEPTLSPAVSPTTVPRRRHRSQ